MKTIIELYQNLASELDKRDFEIFEKKFGLKDRALSLAQIGREYGLTRERIRQIFNRAVKRILNILDNKNYIHILKDLVKQRFNSLNFVSEKELFSSLSKEGFSHKECLVIKTIYQIHPHLTVHYCPEDELRYSYFVADEKVRLAFDHFLKRLVNYFTPQKEILTESEFFSLLQKEIKYHFQRSPNKEELNEIVSILKVIAKNPFNHYGHHRHKFISPSSLNDKIYLILKHFKRPLHFLEIKSILDEFVKKGSIVWQKYYSPGSIVNALYSDKRFVFVGKGKYALKEWKLEEGSAKDLIFKYLKKYRQLPIEKLWEKIFRLRDIKKNSFLIYIKYNSPSKLEIKNGIIRLKK